METRLKEAAVSIKELLPASSAYGQITESVVKDEKKKRKKKKRTQESSVDANGRSEQDVKVKRKKKRRDGNTKEEATNWTFSNVWCSLRNGFYGNRF